MFIPRQLLTIARCTGLALAGLTAAQAAGPWLGHVGRGAPVGVRGSMRVGGGPVVRGVYGGYRGLGGGMVRALPGGYATYRFGGSPWYYGGGIWYRPWGGRFAAFYPPVGLCLGALPFGYMTYYYSGMPYYYYQDVYYTDAPTGGYMVAEPPAGAETYRQAAPAPQSPAASAPAPAGAASPNNAPADALLIIPKEGQNEQKMQTDRQNAQRYAVEESGFDPATGDASDPGTPRARRAYFRAMKSYLEERGYSVK